MFCSNGQNANGRARALVRAYEYPPDGRAGRVCCVLCNLWRCARENILLRITNESEKRGWGEAAKPKTGRGRIYYSLSTAPRW